MRIILILLVLSCLIIRSNGQRPGVNAILVHTNFSKQENYDLVTEILQKNSAHNVRKEPLNDSIILSKPFYFYELNVFEEDNDETYTIIFHIHDSLVTIRGLLERPSFLVSTLTEGMFGWRVEKRIYFDPHRKSDMGRAFKNAIGFANLIKGKKQYIIEETTKPRKKKKK